MFYPRTATRTPSTCTGTGTEHKYSPRAQQQGQNDDRLHSGSRANGRDVPLLAAPNPTWVPKKRNVQKRTQTKLTEKTAAGTLHVESNGTGPRRTG